MADLHDELFGVSPTVRSVALGHGQQVETRSRAGLVGASSAEKGTRSCWSTRPC
ncbi:hypothetical protein ACI782_04630 [Geodermatophilus sp. SYSU D00703]